MSLRQPAPRSTIDPDAADVVAAQQDRAAFAVLYRRYLDRVYGYAYQQLGDHHDAEDATERTFLDAMRGIERYRDGGAGFRPWLFRIAHNTVSNLHRSRGRRRTIALHDGFDQVDPTLGPQGLVLRAEELRRVRRALDELPRDRRQVVLLRFGDGLSSREIGAVLERSEGAVRVLLHRALRDLAARLGPGV
ncbi:MAG: RNA polymerase sigma factor [Chloroflexota bacterium]